MRWINGLIWTGLALTCLGCGSPTVARNGGYVLTYAAESGQEFDSSAMVDALQQRLRAGGFRFASVSSGGDGEFTVELPQADADDVRKAGNLLATLGQMELRILAEKGVHDAEIDEALSAEQDAPTGAEPRFRWVRIQKGYATAGPGMVVRDAPDGGQEVLILIGPNDVTGADFASASKELDASLRPCINATLKRQAAARMNALTSDNLQRRMGIVFDDVLLTAPLIQSTIDERFEITGDFTQEAVEEMVAILRCGTLPARLQSEPTSVKKIDR